jgi:hypothetical protein
MGKPAPFKRPSIDLGGPKRKWQDIEAQYLEPRDLVREYGPVKTVKSYVLQDPLNYITEISFVGGDTVKFYSTDKLHAFAEVSNG